MKPVFGSRAPLVAIVDSPKSLEEFEREMHVTGDRSPRMGEGERRETIRAFIEGIREFAEGIEEADAAKAERPQIDALASVAQDACGVGDV